MDRQKKIFLAFLVLAVLFTYFLLQMPDRTADALYFNATVYTMDAAGTTAEAIAVKGERIVGVGPTAELRERFSVKESVDLEGRTVLPGFIDSHAHLLSLGFARMTLDLVGSSSEAGIAALVEEQVRQSSPGQWIRGRGWDQNLWPSKRFPTHHVLDRVSGDHPVYLERIDGHAAWVNIRAMEEAGITDKTEAPPGGKIVRDAQGNPTGVFIDAAMELVARAIPPPSDQESEQALGIAVKECLQYGITSVHDMGAGLAEIELYKRMIDRDEFPFRVFVAIDGPGDTWNHFLESGPLTEYGNGRLSVRAIKMYMDGALGSRGAALLEPYSDDPTNRGLTLTTEEELKTVVDQALSRGFQVCTHAIGDRGNTIVLDVYEAALKAHNKSDPRLRLEHAQVLFPGDIPRFRELGVIPAMQPTHCTSDMFWAEARLGPSRVRGAYAWQSILATGVMIAGGSDFPVEDPNPLWGLYAAITRQDQRGIPANAEDGKKYFQLSADGIQNPGAFEGGWYSSEKMTREQAVRAFTSWAAHAGFQERSIGSIEGGKIADFIVLSGDVFKVDPKEILTTVVEQTILGGKEVYRRNKSLGALARGVGPR